MVGGGVLGGAGGKSKKKRSDDEPKKNLRPGDLPPRRGRAWNPGAGPARAKESGGGARDGGGDGERLSNVWFEASETLALPAKVAKAAKELSQADVDAKEAIAAKALEERAANYETAWLRARDRPRRSGSSSCELRVPRRIRSPPPPCWRRRTPWRTSRASRVSSLSSRRRASRVASEARCRRSPRCRNFSRRAPPAEPQASLLLRAAPRCPPRCGAHERKRLLYWHVEDLVKRAYSRFVNALDALSRDPLPVLKEKSVKAAYELLRSRPEGERELLSSW